MTFDDPANPSLDHGWLCLSLLSEFKLGIFMSHTHDEKTGEFKLLTSACVPSKVPIKPDVRFDASNERSVTRSCPHGVGLRRQGDEEEGPHVK